MPNKPWPPTPEEHRANQARYQRQLRSITAALSAGMAGLDRGDSEATISAAMKEARKAARLPARARGKRGGPSAVPAKPLPRLSGYGWTAEKQRDFLAHLAETGCVSQACALVGMTRQSAYALRRRASNSVFAVAWDVAIHMARQAMLDEATERALTGREVAVWYHGEQVGTRIVHDNKLLTFLLGLKREPLHPRLDTREMIHLFPTMLAMPDTILPSPLSPSRIEALTSEEEDDADDD